MFKVFPVNKAELRPFRGQITFPLFSDIDEQVPMNWNTDNVNILVNTFKQQLEENVFIFIKKNVDCGKLIENNVFLDDVFMGLSRKDALNRCLKFVSKDIRKGYEDTFYKDTEVFAEEGEKTSQVFAVVLLTNEYVYQGHIYMWITGTNCVAFGIRGRPDKLFSVTNDVQVADALIGKIEILAAENECTQIIVPNPLLVMKNMLLGKFGFAFKQVPIVEIGNLFVGYAQIFKQIVGAAVKPVIAGDQKPVIVGDKEQNDPYYKPFETASLLKGGKKTHRKRLRRRRRTFRRLIMR